MNINNVKIIILHIILLSVLSGCSKDENPPLFSKEEVLGKYYGIHDVLGIIPITDTLTIVNNVKDSVTISSAVLKVSFNAFFDAYSGSLKASGFLADSLMVQPDINIYAKKLRGSGSAILGTDKKSLSTNFIADAELYNMAQVIPSAPTPYVLKDAVFPGTFTRQ